jgi:hypothetical protein
MSCFAKQATQKSVFGITVLVLTILLLSSSCFAQNSEICFELLDQPDGSKPTQLTVSATHTLYEFYQNKDHNLYHKYDLSKFVTPYALEPVADELWNIYNSPEDFVNGVLMMMHQIPYVESVPQKYPVETLVENEGDCDLFCFVAASILKAGGVDVVLLLYEEVEHMTLGVNLLVEPKDTRTETHFLTYDGKKYYVGECTGNFENGWRIGECPDAVNGVPAIVIPLDNMEIDSPDVVSCSLFIAQDSSLFLSTSSNFVIGMDYLKIMGFLSPRLEAKNITLYVSSFRSSLTKLATVMTDSNGRFSYTWDSPPGGVYSIRANWSGDANYVGSDGSVPQVVVIPFLWLMIGAIIAFFLVVLVIVSLATRESEAKI